MEAKKKCLHPTCTCSALPLSDYCGDSCELAVTRESNGEEPLSECHCQHEDCGGQPEVSAEAQGLLMASEVLATA